MRLWKFKLDQVDKVDPIPRKTCRMDVPGPVKDIILQYLPYMNVFCRHWIFNLLAVRVMIMKAVMMMIIESMYSNSNHTKLLFWNLNLLTYHLSSLSPKNCYSVLITCHDHIEVLNDSFLQTTS